MCGGVIVFVSSWVICKKRSKFVCLSGNTILFILMIKWFKLSVGANWLLGYRASCMKSKVVFLLRVVSIGGLIFGESWFLKMGSLFFWVVLFVTSILLRFGSWSLFGL